MFTVSGAALVSRVLTVDDACGAARHLTFLVALTCMFLIHRSFPTNGLFQHVVHIVAVCGPVDAFFRGSFVRSFVRGLTERLFGSVWLTPGLFV